MISNAILSSNNKISLMYNYFDFKTIAYLQFVIKSKYKVNKVISKNTKSVKYTPK